MKPYDYLIGIVERTDCRESGQKKKANVELVIKNGNLECTFNLESLRSPELFGHRGLVHRQLQ